MAGLAQLPLEALRGALAGHFDQPERGKVVHRSARVVARQPLLERAQHLSLVLVVGHVDEVDDDDAAEIAQAQLPRHRLRGLEVGAIDGLLEVALAEEGAGVDVDGGHGLGLVDDQVPTALQRHFLEHGALDLVLDPVQVEHRALTRVMFDPVGQIRHELARETLDALEALARVHPHLVHFPAHQVAHRAQRQAEVVVDGLADAAAGAGFADDLPGALQVGDVLRQRLGALPFRVGAHDVAQSAAVHQPRHDRLQPRPLVLVLDARRHPDHARIGQQHQVAGRNRDLRGQARAFAADRVLDHLHHDFLALVHQRGDRWGRLRRRRRRRRLADALRHAALARLLRQAQDVGRVQERGALQPQFDEGGLHARHYPLHAALVDIADHAAAARALDVQLLQHAVFDQRHACFPRGDVDQDFLGHRTLLQCGRKRRSNIHVSCTGNPMTPV